MSTDIHVRIIKLDRQTNTWKNIRLFSKKKGKFKAVDPYPFRNYELFDILSGNEDEKYKPFPIVLPSLPSNLQNEIKECKNSTGYFDFYEVNLADLKLYLNKVPKIRDYDYEEEDPKAWKDNPVKFFIEHIEYYIELIDPLWDYDPYSSIRIIYWFDR